MAVRQEACLGLDMDWLWTAGHVRGFGGVHAWRVMVLEPACTSAVGRTVPRRDVSYAR